MIPIDDECVPMEGRGTSLTVVAPGGHFTKVPAPDRFTFKGITMHPARAVVDIKMLSISDGRGGGVTVITVMTFMRQLFTRSLAPENLAGAPVDTKYIKAVNDLWLGIGHGGQGWSTLNLDARLGNGFRTGLLAGGIGQEQEKFFIPDNGRGTATTGQLDLPLNILGDTPFGGRLAIGNGAIGIGPAPCGPLVGGLEVRV